MRVSVRIRRAFLVRLAVAASLVALLVLLMACGTVDNPQNTFAAEGDVARKQRDLLIYWVLAPAAVIFVLVQSLLIYAVIRYRRRKEGELPKQVHGNNRLEIAWTIAPAILLLIIAVPTIDLLIDLGRKPADDALQVNVIGQQFSWEFQYPDIVDAEGKPLTVLGLPGKPAEMHVPVGREIALSIESRDVIHSFWVPKLAGKLDAIPGRTNRMYFNATRPGSYAGQCAEFCGLQHADMLLVVIAESEEDFQEWVTDQLEGGGAAGAGSGSAELVSQGE
jgi:cytochrome c oxidase subunit 2